MQNAGSNNIDSERFKQITDFIQSKLDNIGQSQTNTKLNQLEEDIKKETKTVNARKNQLDDIDKYKDELVKKEITNIKQKKNEIQENDRNISTIEEKLQKYNKPSLTTEEKEEKIKLEYQLSDLQSKKEKLNKENEESEAKYNELKEDYDKTKNINDAERNQLENTLKRKQEKNEEEKDKIFFERGKVFFESLISDKTSAEKILGSINDQELQDIKSNPNKLINKINVDIIESLTDLEKTRSTLRYLKSTDLTYEVMEKPKEKIREIEEKIKNIKEKDAKKYDIITEEKDPEKEVINTFSNTINSDNLFEIILSLPISFLEDKSKSEIVNFLSTQIGVTSEEINKHFNLKNYISDQIKFLNIQNDINVHIDYEDEYNDLIKKIKSKKKNLSDINLDSVTAAAAEAEDEVRKFNDEVGLILKRSSDTIIEVFDFFNELIKFYEKISPTIGRFFKTLKTTLENVFTTISDQIESLKKMAATTISAPINADGEANFPFLLEQIRRSLGGINYNLKNGIAGIATLLKTLTTGKHFESKIVVHGPDTKLELELSDAFKKMSQDERDQLGKNSDLLEKLHTNLQDLSDKIDNVEKTIEKTNNKDNTINPKEIEEKLSVILQRLGTITKQPHSGGTKPETKPDTESKTAESESGKSASDTKSDKPVNDKPVSDKANPGKKSGKSESGKSDIENGKPENDKPVSDKPQTEPKANPETEHNAKLETETQQVTIQKPFNINNKHLKVIPNTNSETINSDILKSNDVSLDKDQQKIINQPTTIKRDTPINTQNIDSSPQDTRSLNDKFTDVGVTVHEATLGDPWMKTGLTGIAGYSIVKNFYLNDDGGAATKDDLTEFAQQLSTSAGEIETKSLLTI